MIIVQSVQILRVGYFDGVQIPILDNYQISARLSIIHRFRLNSPDVDNNSPEPQSPIAAALGFCSYFDCSEQPLPSFSAAVWIWAQIRLLVCGTARPLLCATTSSIMPRSGLLTVSWDDFAGLRGPMPIAGQRVSCFALPRHRLLWPGVDC